MPDGGGLDVDENSCGSDAVHGQDSSAVLLLLLVLLECCEDVLLRSRMICLPVGLVSCTEGKDNPQRCMPGPFDCVAPAATAAVAAVRHRRQLPVPNLRPLSLLPSHVSFRAVTTAAMARHSGSDRVQAQAPPRCICDHSLQGRGAQRQQPHSPAPTGGCVQQGRRTAVDRPLLLQPALATAAANTPSALIGMACR